MPEDYKSRFDAAVSAGSFIPSHLPSSTFEEMWQAVKEKGYLIFTMRETFLETLGHKKFLDNMVEQKKI